MRSLVVSITIILLASPAFGQVDTLQLVEIGSIQAPSDITNLYIEDLDDDSLKEIILTTATNIHIYNGITYEPIWTSPELVNPQDLLFEDINNDGLIDLSVRDSLNITLFDPLNSQTIWISPVLDSTYSCYTIGDRNDDDWTDVAIVSKEWFTRDEDPENLDTAWVDIYDGPTFEDEVGFLLLLPNNRYYQGGVSNRNSEVPKKIILSRISASGCLRNLLHVVTNSYTDQEAHNFIYKRFSGRIWVVSALNLEVVYIDDIGRLLLHGFVCSNESTYFYTLGSRSIFFNSMWDYWYDISKIVNTFSADTMLSSSVLWDTEEWVDWKGFTVGETNNENTGNEIAFGAGDSLCLFSFPGLVDIWTNTEAFNILSIPYIYTSSSLFSGPQVICEIEGQEFVYRFFSGMDGSLTTILPTEGISISSVCDLDADTNDELLSIQEYSLQIYNLHRLTEIEDNEALPYFFYVSSNYPNPFNSTTTIEYGLPEAGQVTIEIYDLLGRKVATPVDEEQEAGTYQVVWDAGDRSSGVYFYRITSGGFAETKRMVLLK